MSYFGKKTVVVNQVRNMCLLILHLDISRQINQDSFVRFTAASFAYKCCQVLLVLTFRIVSKLKKSLS